MAPASYLLRTVPSSAYTLRAIGVILGAMGAVLCLMLPKIHVIMTTASDPTHSRKSSGQFHNIIYNFQYAVDSTYTQYQYDNNACQI